YPDGEHNEYVAEQDIVTIPAKYKIGDVVQINSNAESETNGYSLVNHRNWVGTVVSASPKAHASSAWEYDIEYPDGEHNEYVAEQDIVTIPAKYKIGDVVQIN
ncbi:hypothetical protein WOSG25_560010, partial [Weissella oryzae SG25]